MSKHEFERELDRELLDRVGINLREFESIVGKNFIRKQFDLKKTAEQVVDETDFDSSKFSVLFGD